MQAHGPAKARTDTNRLFSPRMLGGVERLCLLTVGLTHQSHAAFTVVGLSRGQSDQASFNVKDTPPSKYLNIVLD